MEGQLGQAGIRVGPVSVWEFGRDTACQSHIPYEVYVICKRVWGVETCRRGVNTRLLFLTLYCTPHCHFPSACCRYLSIQYHAVFRVYPRRPPRLVSSHLGGTAQDAARVLPLEPGHVQFVPQAHQRGFRDHAIVERRVWERICESVCSGNELEERLLTCV